MRTFQKRVAVRIAAVSLLLASVASPVSWWIAHDEAERSIVSLALEESRRLLSYYDANDLTSPDAARRAVSAAQTLSGGLFDIVEIYDAQGGLLADSHTERGAQIESLLNNHQTPNYQAVSQQSLKLSNGMWVMRVLVPLFGEHSNATKVTGYFEGVRIVPAWQQQQIRDEAFAVALMVCLASLLCGMSIYPVVIRLSAENEYKTHEVLESHIAMMDALGRAIAKRDSDTGEHNYRVAWIASRIAECMGLTGNAMQSLIAGSFLHDVGKVGIPDHILLKPDKLTEAEYRQMQQHVVLGEEIVSGMGWLQGAYEIVSAHHERWDGNGYPRRLSGEAIPLAARIFAVADVFDALISKRPYKEALNFAEVMDILEQESGTHFDPAVMEVFRSIARDVHHRLSHSNETEARELLASRVRQYFET